jgi:hypothetical protein
MNPLERSVWAAAYVHRLETELILAVSRDVRVKDAIWKADRSVSELREAFAVTGRAEDLIGASADAGEVSK